MNKKDINILLQKFYQGDTDLEEEIYLSEFFKQTHLPPDWDQDRKVFLALSRCTEEVPSELKQKVGSLIDLLEQEEKTKAKHPVKTELRRRFIGLVASLLLIAGIGLWVHFREGSNSLPLADTYDNPQQAQEATIKALQLFSQNFSKGTQSIDKVDKQIGTTLEIIHLSLDGNPMNNRSKRIQKISKTDKKQEK